MNCCGECHCPARDAIYLLEDLLAEDLPEDVVGEVLNFLNRSDVLPYLAQGLRSDAS